MSLVGALNQLTGLSYPGVTTSYDYDETPGLVAASELPALVVAPASGGEGLKALDVSFSSGVFVVYVLHMLITAAPGLDTLSVRSGSWAQLVDDYFATVAGDLTLNDNLAEPLQVVSTSFGVQAIGNTMYTGLAFRHRWVFVTS